MVSFKALENTKVGVLRLSNLQPQLEDQRVTISILSKSCRKSNSHHSVPFPDEKYSILTIWTIFSEIVDYCMGRLLYGSIFDPIFDPHMANKKNFPKHFFS